MPAMHNNIAAAVSSTVICYFIQLLMKSLPFDKIYLAADTTMDIAPGFVEKNKDILLRLQSDSLYSLSITEEGDETALEDFEVREGDDLGCLGYHIGKCTSLDTLYIRHIPGDIEINGLLRGINRNRSIQDLVIHDDRGDEMLGKLSGFLRKNKSISCLDLHGFGIGCGRAGELASIIRTAPLTRLVFSENELCNEAFKMIVTAASSAQSQIECLCLGGNNVGEVGCTRLATLLESRALNKLKELDLDCNSIDDNLLQTLSAGLVNNKRLEKLSLCGNPRITADGLRSLTPFLQSESCALNEFFFYHNNFGDAGAAALADGLTKNKSLKKLWFDPSNCGMTSTGWQSFATLLCDTSSINNTYQSNHTIELIGESCNYGSPVNQVHERVRELLRLHENANSREIAKCKIFLNHRDLDVEPLFEWGLKFLPLVVSWFGNIRGCDMLPTTNAHYSKLSAGKLSAVYKFIRGMPALTAVSHWQKLDANANALAKRRRMDDEMRRLESDRSRLYHEEEEERLSDRPRSEGSSSSTNHVSGTKRMRP